mmetsp:Transcript_40546/g.129214  ORF Transcript_40546/g.129214 Transcript_40546/m.129214 type:complete len:329 (-) Transcript_40546:100-1086(-)
MMPVPCLPLRAAGCAADEGNPPSWYSGHEALWANRTRRLASPGRVTILPLGDSLTKGAVNNKCGNARGARGGGGKGAACSGGHSYRYFLGWSLEEDWGTGTFEFVGSRPSPNCAAFRGCGGLPGDGPQCAPCTISWDLGHDGHRAWTTRDILAGKQGREPGIAAWLKTAPVPDIVLLMIGTNDIFKGFADPSTAVKNLRGVLGILRGTAKDSVIMIQQIVPFGRGVKRWRGTGLERANAKVKTYNAALEKLVVDMNREASLGGGRGKGGTLRPYVLVKQAFSDTGKNMMRDGVHPSEEGERLIAARWRGHLTRDLAEDVLQRKASRRR